MCDDEYDNMSMHKTTRTDSVNHSEYFKFNAMFESFGSPRVLRLHLVELLIVFPFDHVVCVRQLSKATVHHHPLYALNRLFGVSLEMNLTASVMTFSIAETAL